MTKTLELEVVSSAVPSPGETTLQERIQRIRVYHQGFIGAFAQQTGYAFLCGVELNAAKAELKHGQFTKWREQHLPQISNGSAANYMRFAQALQNEFPAVGKITAKRLVLSEGRLDSDDQAAILQAVRTATDGASLTQLYRELDIIRQPKRQRYSAPKQRSPEENARAVEQQAVEHADALCADLEFLTLDLLARLPNAKRKQLLDALIEKSNLIRSLGKEAKPVAAAPSPQGLVSLCSSGFRPAGPKTKRRK